VTQRDLSPQQASELISRLDELVQEAARLREQITAAMRRELEHPFWPDRRRVRMPHYPERRRA
jgi:uncharacterized tellurite resistance protein B-like protein